MRTSKALCIFLVFLIHTIGYASASETPKGTAKSLTHNSMKGHYAIRTVCVDGYKFVVANRVYNMGRSYPWPVDHMNLALVQFYENDGGKAVPAKC